MNSIVQAFHSSSIQFIDKGHTFDVVASHIAYALEYAKTDNFLNLIDEDYKGTAKVSTLGGEQIVSTVSEFGLYQGLARSNKPKAKAFQKWLFEEVLPSIRKTGSYSNNQNDKYAFELEKIKLKHQQRIELEEQKQRHKIELMEAKYSIENKPDVDEYKKLLNDIFVHIQLHGEITPRVVSQRFAGRKILLKGKPLTVEFAKSVLKTLAESNDNVEIVPVRTSIKARLKQK